MKKSLKEILRLVVNDRKPTIWAKKLGIPVSSNSRLFKDGILPSDKHLRKIMVSENVSISAMLGANRPPFFVQHTKHSKETYKLLAMQLADNDWTVHIITGDIHPIIVLSTPAETEVDGEVFAYTMLEVVYCPVNQEVAGLFNNFKVYHKDLSVEDTTRIINGLVGTYELLLKDKALLHDANIISQPQLSKLFQLRSDKNALLITTIMDVIDQTIESQGITITKDEWRMLVASLYNYALDDNLVATDISKNLASSILRLI